MKKNEENNFLGIYLSIIENEKKIYENIFLGYFPVVDMKKKWMNVFLVSSSVLEQMKKNDF